MRITQPLHSIERCFQQQQTNSNNLISLVVHKKDAPPGFEKQYFPAPSATLLSTSSSFEDPSSFFPACPSVVGDGAVRRRVHRRRLRDGRPRRHHSLRGHGRRRRGRHRGRRGRGRVHHRHRHVRWGRLRHGRRRGDRGRRGRVQGLNLLRVPASERMEMSECATRPDTWTSHLIHCPVTLSFL